eukprot:CAMPEP_0198551116 /NCGR_PEP_ID=MMETSP1462-20131121/76098_1 /TAXON_ID=1333877 /ORGANISM="Brandtodinium nutriculum, Strain RCC3387" /LENGTH=66 /DNA_ID=CAMNT_0044281751 /DNA_START=44 /DNA_END=240 /DNA_ORIENTATION=+
MDDHAVADLEGVGRSSLGLGGRIQRTAAKLLGHLRITRCGGHGRTPQVWCLMLGLHVVLEIRDFHP